MQLSILTDENQQKNAQNLRHKSCKKTKKEIRSNSSNFSLFLKY